MAQSDFLSAGSLLPALLSKLARQTGRAAGLEPLWTDVAGEVIAKVCRPLRVEQQALIVSAPDAAWQRRIEEHAQELGGRLKARTHGQLEAVRAEVQR